MLLGTVVLWSLNTTVSRYLLTHDLKPLAYATTRYFAATVLFAGFTWQREHSFRIRLSDGKLVAIAAMLIFVNQLCFVSAVHRTTASTVSLIFGTTPIFAGIGASLVGLERPGRMFWMAAGVSFVGVGFVAGGGVSHDLFGDALAVCTAATWAGYSVTIAPLMRRYSPFRISSVVLACGWVPLAIVSIPQLLDQGIGSFGPLMWIAFAYAVIGPLFLTNILWFTAIRQVGPSRATLFANLQPFVGVFFALVLLSEKLTRWEVIGGTAIAAAIILERVCREPRVAQPVE